MTGTQLRSAQPVLLLTLALLAGVAQGGLLDGLASNATTTLTQAPAVGLKLCTGSSRYQCMLSCYSSGMRLAVIKDLDTNNKIRDFLTSSKVDKAYVGMDDQAREGYFQRTDGTFYVKEDFSRWASASGKPEQANEGDDCVTIDSSGNWRVESCTLLLPSVCQAATGVTAPSTRWTAWCSSDNNPADGDNENINFARAVCGDICNNPLDWKCRVVGTDSVLSGLVTSLIGLVIQNFTTPCSREGLVCDKTMNLIGCMNYEVAYLCPADIDECAAKLHNCDPNAQCINTPGSYSCQCKSGYSGDGFTCQLGSTCSAFGSTHVVTFDGAHQFGGSRCDFVLAANSNSTSGARYNFSVDIRQDLVGAKVFITGVSVRVYDLLILIDSVNGIKINGMLITPVSQIFSGTLGGVANSSVSLQYIWNDIVVSTDYGLKVSFDLRRFVVTVFVPQIPEIRPTGLCGDADGRLANDLTPRGSTATSTDRAAVYGSWLTSRQSNANCNKADIALQIESSSVSSATVSVICNAVIANYAFSTYLSDASLRGVFNDACRSDIVAPFDDVQLCLLTTAFYRVLSAKGLLSSAQLFPPGLCQENATCRANEQLAVSASPCEPSGSSCAVRSSSDCSIQRLLPTCRCRPGFLRSGDACVPQTECGCTPTDGTGYRAKGQSWCTSSCAKKNTCNATNTITSVGNQCGTGTKCVQLPDASSFCDCASGYEGPRCEDIDECAKGLHACSDQAVCVNTAGAYKCQCLPGYQGDGFNCTDINECAAAVKPCSANAICSNTPGSFACACVSPYVGDGKSCSVPFIAPNYANASVGESGCSYLKELQCDPTSVCSDLANGSISCACAHGAVGDGYSGTGHTGCKWPNCPTNYTSIEGFCYYYDATKRNLTSAVDYCATLGGTPATILNDLVASQMKVLLNAKLVTTRFWTGYADPKTSGYFPPLDFLGSLWLRQWLVGVNKTTANDPAVGSYRPDLCSSGILNAGVIKLEAVPCSDAYSTVCKVPGAARSCPEGWQSLGSFCYYMSDNPLTYDDAMLQCALLGSDLVSVTNNDVSKFLFDYFFNARAGSGYHWIGQQYNTLLAPGSWAWWDGSSYNPNYLMWESASEPAAGKQCTAINTSARWAAKNCTDKLGYICQKQRWAYYRCPQGSYYFKGKCYAVNPVSQNFTSHLADCRAIGGDLIAFGTPQEYNFFDKVIYRGQSGPRTYFTGLYLPTDAKNFTYTDGSAAVYLNWIGGAAIGNESLGRCTQVVDPAQGFVTVNCSSTAWAVCEFVNTPCMLHSDCAANGECFLGQCRCKKGYFGDGKRSCIDVDECKISGICQEHSTCTNLVGSYRCDCDTEYQLNADGKCQNIRYCVSNSDCLRLAACVSNLCTCNTGYQGDGIRNCADVDECALGTHDCNKANATCTNNPGSFTCKCNNGFIGDGRYCRELPRTCHELRLRNMTDLFAFRSTQKIDPDGTGPMDALDVTCEMYTDYGITVFPPDANNKYRYSGTGWVDKIIYSDLVEEMTAVVGNSFFCLQVIKFNCYYGSNPMNDILYYDRNNVTHQDWGSGTEGKCLCGTVGLCRRKTASCNCNGDTSRYLAADYGYVINRDLLPLRGFRGRSSVGSAEYNVAELRCSGVQFDIGATCDDVADKSSSNVHLIDPDQRGSLPPFPALCFNPFCNYAQIASATVVSHDNFGQQCSYGLSKQAVKGDNPITYCAPVGQLALLKAKLAFCSQEIRYDCNNSPLVSTGNEASRFYTLDKKAVPNMGHGSPANNTCPCAALNRCLNGKSCNCDNTGVGATYDFGWVYNKDHLPIMGLTTQNINPSSSGNISVGYFACSSKQFGVMGTCQMYRTRFRDDDDNTFIFRNYQDDYVYPIDPDLKSTTIQPFPVYCDFQNFETGVTVIPNLAPGSSACSGTSALCATKARYFHTIGQIAAIASRSTYCSQSITYRCRQSPLLKGTNETTKYAYWKSYRTNVTRYDFGRQHQTAIDGGIGCGCYQRGVASCVASTLKCACDASSILATSEDIILDDKTALPVDSMYVSGLENYVEFGDMLCYDVSDSCYNRYKFGLSVDTEESCIYQRLGDLYLLPNQYKGGFYPIPGRCNPGGETEIQVVNSCVRTTASDVNQLTRERCYDVQYYSAGVPISNDQVAYLVKQSTYCIQYASFVSKQTSFTGNVRWKSLYGDQFTNWAGTQGRPGCACGITGTCNRTGDACNTDRASSELIEDRGWFVNYRSTGDLVPLTQVCTKLGSNATAETTICLDSVRCMESTSLRIPKDCQDIRDGNYLYAPTSTLTRRIEPWIINPYDGSDKPPSLATCDQTNTPPTGVTVVGTKTCGTFDKAGGLLNLTYHGFPTYQLEALIQSSTYCTQRVEFKCKSAAFSAFAVDKSGAQLSYWGGSGGSGCNGGACQCDGLGTAWKIDEAVYTNKNILPLSSVTLSALASADSQREVCVHELRCHKIYPDCHSYYTARGTPPFPNGRNELAVDPDQAGPLRPFSIACDITSCPDTQNRKVYMGVTRFYLNDFSGTQSYTINAVKGNATSASFSYVSPNATQAAALADQAGQCWQLVHAYSQRSGLLGAGARIFDRSGAKVTYFSGSDIALTTGCACQVLGTCANDSLCHSDEGVAGQTAKVLEGTYVINKGVLPITAVTLPALASTTPTMQIYVETMRCAPNYCGLPRHCSEVSTLGRRTTFEQWIQPGSSPFLVLCVPGASDWATRVIVDKVTRNSSGYTTVTYKTATPAQLTELVQSLTSCTQAVKVTCRGYRLMANAGFALISATGQRSRKFVSGAEQCACGDRDSCQGTTRAEIDSRACNCDIGDNVTRADSGVFSQDGSSGSRSVPIVGIDTSGADASGSAIWQLSDVFCGQRRINLDECSLGLHDCDINADCAEADTASITCTCRPGWRGLGVPGVIANGRQCFDDNECALGKCGDHTTCVNLPGTFRCDCQPGYKHSTDTVCVDIDECATGTHNCDSNARCINTDGSFICVCLPNFEGSGRAGDCREVGSCLCWGEPHCRSFDERIHHFQGACSYTLARDGCVSGSPSGTPTFEVVQKNWKKDKPDSVVTWTKEIMVRIFGRVIVLRQGMRVVLDGQQINLPADPVDAAGQPIGLSIKFFESNVFLTTKFGLYVKWNGDDRIEVKVEAPFKRQVCGLCGNFDGNADNDWVLGPFCPPSGNATDNPRLFGDSWRTDTGSMDGDECKPSCSSTPDPVCVGDAFERAKTDCAKLRQVFATCIASMTAVNDTFEPYIDGCVYDTCIGGVNLCQTASTIAAVCQSRYNSTVQWRSASFCPLTCGVNMHYETCAAPCQATCVQPNMTVLMLNGDCRGRCTEACVCNTGYVMTSGNCVLPTQCGCQVSGMYYNVGDLRVKPNCTERCNCTIPGSSSLTCSPYKCHQYGYCGFEDDMYDCHCLKGFHGDGVQCDDDDECAIGKAANKGPCSPQATCTNKIGSYNCTCNTGWRGDGVVCDDIDECQSKPCNATTEECFNSPGSYECRCLDGFMRNATTKICDDKDECKLNQNSCDRSSTDCRNTFGRYACDCKSGYTRVDQYTCKDINECANSSLNNCDKNYGSCTNNPGSYKCACRQGFSGDGTVCVDVNECNNPNVCYINATCNNTIGSFFCTCDDGNRGCTGPDPCLGVKCNGTQVYCYRGVCYCERGFVKNVTTGLCQDENECLTGNNNCTAMNALCLNTFGSYECQCLVGFVYNPVTKKCTDIDECLENQNDCRGNAKCVNTQGGYQCQCQDGFMGHCEECRDIDECEFSLHSCDQTYATCNNTIGSFLCKCNPGFEGNGKVCYDVNECLRGLANCPPKAACINVPGSFQCQCSVGYILTKAGTCEDEDECLSSKNDCSVFSKCINNVGSYSCQCQPGYSGDGIKCTKDNTKLDCNGVTCNTQATCNNDTCVCLGGFEGDGRTCTDIDECTRYPGLCDKQATCYNTPGSYACQCKQGFSGDGKICTNGSSAVAPCMRTDVCVGGICTDLSNGQYKCECRSGYVLKNDACIDVDECKTSDSCSAVDNSECRNIPGSFLCACSLGFEEQIKDTGRVCSSIDQCARNKYLCGANARCISLSGGYTCQCQSGFAPVTGSQPLTCATGGDNFCNGVDCPVGAYCKLGACVCLPPAYIASTTIVDGVTKFSCRKVQEPCASVTCPANSTCQGDNGGVGCACNPGLHFSPAGVCVDVRECDNPLLNDCDLANGRCIELIGSYRCECSDGYQLDAVTKKCVAAQSTCNCGSYGICLRNNSCWCRTGYTDVGGRCVDINECSALQQPCHRLADCTNTPGSFSCKCPLNYDGDGYNFCDLNECTLGKTVCASNARCLNTLGSYRCECPDGYIGDGKTCVKGDNPCLFNNGGCGSVALCTYADKQVTCQCPSGYRGNGLQCYDINECMEGTHNCDKDHAICSNNPGSFFCLCKPGYMGDGVSCKDIDECVTGKSNCHKSAVCTNNDGSYSCACKPGFRGDGTATCEDVGDCRANNLCDANARCVYTPQGYTCQCSSGFQGNGFDPCKDIDECALGTHKCVKNADCVNNPGSYACQCTTGFVGDGRSFCNDINECLDPKSCASQNLTVCVNLPGGYSCPCAPGAQLRSGRCEDINECESAALNKCSAAATCTNTAGSYTCACKTGYIGDGIDCQDVDECASGTANCFGSSLCINTPGSFNCQCSAGLLGNGTTCDDVNECDKNKPTHQCHELATCINKNPGYECVCPAGYLGTGFFCAQRNPCSTPGLCSQNATCVFDGNSTKCVCKSGYSGTGRVCLAENECTSGSNPCDPVTSDCQPKDPIGSTCVCKPGFHLEGTLCVDDDECDPSSPKYIDGVCGSALISKCVNTAGGFNCICTDLAVKSGVTCIPLDVCQKGGTTAGCHPEANCLYQSPGYSCVCKAGFEGDGKNCTDVNECTVGSNNCYGEAICKNLPGGYKCECPKGYLLADDPRTCNDVDECANDPFICGNYSRCQNTRGSYTCDCIRGYSWNSTSNRCEDVDECKTGTHPCHSLAQCTNTPGSCTCHCGAGYTGDGVYFCELTQNCPPVKSLLCPVGTTCRDQGNGTFDCRCGTDQLDKGVVSCATGVCVHTCQTVDPCWTKASRCSPFAQCKTVAGEARCFCLDGFSGDGVNCDDVNECAGRNQCNSTISQCRNLDNRVDRLNYTCDCAAGYESVLGTYSCVNINECDRGTAKCPANSRCVDTPGSYRCDCNAGYKPLSAQECVDIDECTQNTDDCNRATAECLNLAGSFACRCKLGLEMRNRTHCQDINECATPGVCGSEQTCRNVFASYSCSCPVGFTVSGVYCVDVNECTRSGSCHATALCNNTRGGYNCYCAPGQRMSLTGACEHINECAERANACPTGAVCVDSLATGYSCACPKGYNNPPGNFSQCEDINECDIGQHNCTGKGSVCVNTIGAFKCTCQTGFVEKGGDCVDIDECQLAAQVNLTFCQPGTCQNTPGSYLCICPVGYDFRDGACANINECKLPSASRLAARCPANQICIDTIGSYRCYCPKGFILDASNNCVDIDECKSANACPNGVCTNIAGNYTCTCTTGYRPNGPFICVDIDECTVPNVCGDTDYGVCTNLPGSFNCTCKPGSALVDRVCRKIDECVLANVTCPPNSQCVSTASGHRCDCNPGYETNDIGQCLNIDECGRGTHKCDLMADCADTIGSYSCACKKGYSGDGRTCQSVCESACAANQMCKVTEQNTPQCTCDCVGKRCLVQGQVCDSKGRTHASEKAMYEFACKALESNLTVSYFSACKDSCSVITCPESHICSVDTNLNKPLCKCRPCTDDDRNSGPVCTTDLVQFSNRCDYIKYKCYWKDSVSLSNMSVCRQPINCKVSEWSQWGGCSRTCGLGFQVRTRTLLRDSQFNGTCPFEMTAFAECFSGPCPDGPCRTVSCPTSHICVDVNSTAVCKCPSCSGRGDTNVCGLLGNRTDTFTNLCELERQACELNATYNVYHQGPCGEVPPAVPATCSLVYNFKKFKFPDSCESEDLLPLHNCDGGCGNSTTKCCVPLHTRTITARYRCPDKSLVIRAIDVNVSCACQDKSHYVTG